MATKTKKKGTAGKPAANKKFRGAPVAAPETEVVLGRLTEYRDLDLGQQRLVVDMVLEVLGVKIYVERATGHLQVVAPRKLVAAL